MYTVLNDRQNKIFNDLKNSRNPITGKMLAGKYDVSLRTIRNDIRVITEFLEAAGGVIIKVPKVGMRIIDAGDEAVYQAGHYDLANLIYFDGKKQMFMIFAYFLLNENPITIEHCTELFRISKGTFLTKVKEFNEFLRPFSVRLRGQKNKGYYLDCDQRGLLEAYEYFRTEIKSAVIYDILDNDRRLIDEDTKAKTDALIVFLERELSLAILHRRTLFSLLASFIKIKKIGRNYDADTVESEHHRSDQAIAQYIMTDIGIDLSETDAILIDYILDMCTDLSETRMVEDQELLARATQAFLVEVIKERPELATDHDNLKIDIMKHIRSTLTRKSLNITNVNPLLKQIKARFCDAFFLTKKAIKAFEKLYPLDFNEDEIGFITLYIQRSLDRFEKIRDAKVMVICNTGRGASKLLATRIMNNLPEIHIVAMVSSDELSDMGPLLDEVDLIISTMTLENIDKPYIVVSPFCSEREVQMVKEAAFISLDGRSSIGDQRLNDLVTSIVTQYVEDDKAAEFTAKIYKLVADNKVSAEKIDFEDISEIAIDIMQLVAELYPQGLKGEDYNRVAGIFAHTLMSIPRWLESDFIKAYDSEELIARYPRRYKTIEDFLGKMEKRFSITIDRVEAIAILRYMI